MAAPEREVFVMVGDGSYLMMAQEIVTAVQVRIQADIVLLDNHGFFEYWRTKRACGIAAWAPSIVFAKADSHSGDLLPVDFVATPQAWERMRSEQRRVASCELHSWMRVSDLGRYPGPLSMSRVPGYESWWDVPIRGKVADSPLS